MDYATDNLHHGTVFFFTLSHHEYFDKVQMDILVCKDHRDLLFVQVMDLDFLELRDVVFYKQAGAFDCDFEELRQELSDYPFENINLTDEEIEELTSEARKTLSFVGSLPPIRVRS